jgi:DNA-binding MarR family transcriptional regulator
MNAHTPPSAADAFMTLRKPLAQILEEAAKQQELNLLPTFDFMSKKDVASLLSQHSIHLKDIAAKASISIAELVGMLNKIVRQDYETIEKDPTTEINHLVAQGKLKCPLFGEKIALSEGHRNQLELLYRAMLMSASARLEDKTPAIESAIENSLPNQQLGIQGILRKLGVGHEASIKYAEDIAKVAQRNHRPIGID